MSKNIANMPKLPIHWQRFDLSPYDRPEEVPRRLVIRHVEHGSGFTVPPHAHGWAQLLYAYEGTMKVVTEVGQWLIPPQRAVWIPPLMVHAIESIENICLRNVYLNPEAIIARPDQCRVVQVTPLLRELIAEIDTYPLLYEEEGTEGRMVSVLLDQIKTLQESPLHLPIPTDNRLRRIADSLLLHPDDNCTLLGWAGKVGASERTLARLFKQQTGLSFGQWRQQLRLLEALARISKGQRISAVAADLGYDTPSAFIAMFKRVLGKTPKQYFSTQFEQTKL
ncbi:MAG: helix-turn-helix transcriptional regulator [Motiliproteus sp.]